MTVAILVGDVREKLRTLPADSFDCVVTSPPYWGLRDYGIKGQLGLEETLGDHIDAMVNVFAEVHRVLKPTGTLWLNYGDCYATKPNGRSAADTKAAGNDDRTFRDKPFDTTGAIYRPGYEKTARGAGENFGSLAAQHGGRVVGYGPVLKPKDLCMIPNRLAIALQEWGWWVRAENIWAKPNPMPESIKDRPGTSHEKVWMLSKSARYYFAADEVKQEATSDHASGNGFVGRQGGAEHMPMSGGAGSVEQWQPGGYRNIRNYERAPLTVWEIPAQGFRDAHFATFPPELVERCLKAGCPKGGTVLDPFGGAGTTALVADQMQRDCTIIELNPDYVHIAARRIEQDRGDIQNALDPLQIDLLQGAA